MQPARDRPALIDRNEAPNVFAAAMRDDALALVAVSQLPRVRVPGFPADHVRDVPVPCGHITVIEVKNS